VTAPVIAPVTTPGPAVLRPILAGLSASLVAIGLARFAYTPLLPALIQAHWFSTSAAVYLGAANLAGYLLGALAARPLAGRTGNVAALRTMMLLASLCFLACAFPLSVAWFFGWRLLSGVAGGATMVLVAATILPHMPEDRRGTASGAVFLGLGLGIAASGTLVPLLLGLGLREAWIGLAALSALLTAACWTSWPASPPAVVVQACTPPHGPGVPGAAPAGAAARVLYAEYALMAVGLVPAMVFLVDFIARGLGAGARTGSVFWILYGVGAMAGPPVYGFCADRLGARTALRLLLAVQAVAVAVLATSGYLALIGFCCLLIGSFPPGIVPLVLARVHDIVPTTERQNAVWTRATIVFAASQALSGYAYSALFDATGGHHRLLFMLGAAAVLTAIPLDLACSALARRLRPGAA
jgi:predicted MFS family arabinose efflux permease